MEMSIDFFSSSGSTSAMILCNIFFKSTFVTDKLSIPRSAF